jgi:phage/plasmid-like protein (TIGR03299 family)
MVGLRADHGATILVHLQKEEFAMGLIPDLNKDVGAFTVRNPAWWDENGKFDLDDYPGREEAMRLADHAWEVETVPVYSAFTLAQCEAMGLEPNKPNGLLRKETNLNHVRSDNGFTLKVHTESFQAVSNSLVYDIAEWILENSGFQYQCGISMDGGRVNALTLLLDDPIQVKLDRAKIFPLLALSWAHDGTGAVKCRSTTIRNECANTISASEAEAKNAGTDFTFRHTKNVKDRIEDAKKAIQGVGPQITALTEALEELGEMNVTPEQRDLFVSTIIGDRVTDRSGSVSFVSQNPNASKTVKTNIEQERKKILNLFMGTTIPEDHSLTGYGLLLAGGEYFDHLRAYRSKDTYVNRTLLKDNPAKASLVKTIREVVAA